MKRYFLLIVSLLFVGAIVVGCSSNDASTEINEAVDEAVDEANDEAVETTSEDSSWDGSDPESLGIKLRSHDYDEAEEEIDRFDDHGDGYYFKDGENLTLPEEFPSDFPIAEGMTVVEVSVKESVIDVLLDDGGNYTFEQLTKLYNHYIHTAGYDDAEFAEDSSLTSGLDVYIGMKEGSEYVIGVDDKFDYNVVTLSIYRD